MPLVLVIVGLATWWLVRAATRLRSVSGTFAFLLVALLLTHSMVEFPLYFLYFLVPFSMAIGIISNDVAPEQCVALPFLAKVATPLVFALVGAFAVVDYFRIEDDFRDMRFTVARFGTPMPAEPPPVLRTEFTQLAAYHHFSLMTPKAPIDAHELAWMRDVAYRYPYSPTLYRYALAQALGGDTDGAQSTLAALRNMYGDKTYGNARADLVRMSETVPVLRQIVLRAPPAALDLR